MDFRHLIVTCLFSKLRLPFDNQKVKENYAILSSKAGSLFRVKMKQTGLFCAVVSNRPHALLSSQLL